MFTSECLQAFDRIEEALISAPIIQPPDWSVPLKLMCDASDIEVGAVLVLIRDKKSFVIYYASKTLNEA